MLSTEIQRSVRLNKKKKSTNISPYPDEAIERLARAFYPAILACWNSEEGQREFAAWQAEQAHIATKEKQEVPVGELPALLIVCGFLQGASGRAHPVFVFMETPAVPSSFAGCLPYHPCGRRLFHRTSCLCPFCLTAPLQL